MVINAPPRPAGHRSRLALVIALAVVAGAGGCGSAAWYLGLFTSDGRFDRLDPCTLLPPPTRLAPLLRDGAREPGDSRPRTLFGFGNGDASSERSIRQRIHDFSVFGPNGYLRGFRGRATGLEVTARPDGADLRLVLTNSGRSTTRFTVTDAYGGRETHTVRPGGRAVHTAKPRGSHSWYDLSVTAGTDATLLRRFAGHIETGGAGVSDPAISPS